MRLVIASYNIQYGLGQDGVFDTPRIADAVQDADIILFQEVCQHWDRNDGQDQVAVLAERLNRYVVFGSTFDMDASTVEDGRIVNRRKTFGNMVASRWPIVSSRTQLLPKHGLPETMDVQRCVVEAVIRTPAGDLRAYSVHLSHISPGQRLPQVEVLMDMIRRAPMDGAPFDADAPDAWGKDLPEAVTIPQPVVLAGDFNCTPDSTEYAAIAGEWHAERVRLRRADQLIDSWAASGQNPFEPSTFYKAERAAKIDHIFMSPDLAAGVSRSWIDSEQIASDHYPIFVELDWG